MTKKDFKKLSTIMKKVITLAVAGTMLIAIPVFADSKGPSAAEQQKKVLEFAEFKTNAENVLKDLDYDYWKVDRVKAEEKLEAERAFMNIQSQLDNQLKEGDYDLQKALEKANTISDKDKRKDAVDDAKKKYDKIKDNYDKERDKAVENMKKEKEKADKEAKKEQEKIKDEMKKVRDSVKDKENDLKD